MNYYYFKYLVGEYIYSCDMMRFKLNFRQDELPNVVTTFDSYMRLDVKNYPLCTQKFRFRNFVVIDYNYSTLELGIGFNGIGTDCMFEGFVQFNPNKCFQNDQCLQDLRLIFSSCWSVDLLRWDFAIDIPVERYRVKLVKDSRRFQCVRNSADDFTEYLGVRSHLGFVKVYNKKIESDLLQDLTRVEITMPDLLGSGEDFSKYFPTVYIQRLQNEMEFGISSLSDTDKVLVELLQTVQNPDYYIKRLGRGKREKLEKYIYADCDKLEINVAILFQLYNDYKSLLVF